MLLRRSHHQGPPTAARLSPVSVIRPSVRPAAGRFPASTEEPSIPPQNPNTPSHSQDRGDIAMETQFPYSNW
ncbi:hypothetical protein GCM10012287_31190 [Streptomyces daqingensis]|uniref:Uncharacterized protein n=1 Tax=Streptomyces daqingensis TaxID=1472640 RepID=A0ABQ2MFS0_9ACTN|nr:hypothetical protein GCM10012287_31190 [Streptomyces daqingensis]